MPLIYYSADKRVTGFEGALDKQVEIPSAATSVGSRALYRCKSRTYVKLPDALKSIGTSAFEQSSLVFMEIPDSVTDIGGCAFLLCEDAVIFCSRDLYNLYFNGKIADPSKFIVDDGASITIINNGVEKRAVMESSQFRQKTAVNKGRFLITTFLSLPQQFFASSHAGPKGTDQTLSRAKQVISELRDLNKFFQPYTNSLGGEGESGDVPQEGPQ